MGVVASLQHRNVTYVILGITAAQAGQQYNPVMEQSIRSYKPVSDPAVLNVQPPRLQLVTLSEAMTGSQFVQRYPSTVPAEQVYVINGIDAGSTLQRGDVLKRVMGGNMPK